MRKTMAATGLVLAATFLALPMAAQAETAGRGARSSQPVASEVSAQSRRARPRVRIYRNDDRGVYPSYFPGPNAVRDCTATYVQEHRPSGTVIVPRMNCFWRPG
jgi:hypothetical protein